MPQNTGGRIPLGAGRKSGSFKHLLVKIFLQGSDTYSATLDSWVVLNEDGGIIARIYEPTLDPNSELVLVMQSGERHSVPTSEAGDFEVYRRLISSSLGTDNYDLVVKPIPPSQWGF
jgi:hypothetical protein